MEGHELEFSDEFDGDDLDHGRWLPAHLPQWSSRARAAARYRVGGGRLVLEIAEDQSPWCPEFDGLTRVSSLQTGVFSGPADSPVGQHRFNPRAVVREPQPTVRLYTPRYGHFEVSASAPADPRVMVAFWMIGFEDAPERSAEICVFEIFGRDVCPGRVRVGMGVHPFGDLKLIDDFRRVPLDIDVTEPHAYAARWTPSGVTFFVDGEPVRKTRQSPDYPMQLMLGVYEFDSGDASSSRCGDDYPKEFVVDHVRGFRPRNPTGAD